MFFNNYIQTNNKKFVDVVLNKLKVRKDSFCYKPTYMQKKSFGNSRNKKIIDFHSKDTEYYDWWNYLNKNEIYFLDYFFRSFFKIFKNKINQNYKEKNTILIYFKIFIFFFKRRL